jgi:hypothetical protein
MELFDVVKNIFKNDKEWSKVKSIDKSRNFFMINRIMAIQFPIQANQFNHTKIIAKHVIDWWHVNLSKNFSRTPEWIYTKTKKSSTDQSKKEDFFLDEETERFILQRFEISKREIQELQKFHPEKFKEWASSIKEQLSGVSKK